MMQNPPKYLVMISYPKEGVEIWSAHHQKDNADNMAGRVATLLDGTTAVVQVIVVPDRAGVCNTDKPIKPDRNNNQSLTTPKAPAKKKPVQDNNKSFVVHRDAEGSEVVSGSDLSGGEAFS